RYNFFSPAGSQKSLELTRFSIQFLSPAGSQKSLELTRVFDNIFFAPVSIDRSNCRGYACSDQNYLLKSFFERFGKSSNLPEINASFFALDHFLICFSLDTAKKISVNSA